jgi:hypothetical protein
MLLTEIKTSLNISKISIRENSLRAGIVIIYPSKNANPLHTMYRMQILNKVFVVLKTDVR